MPSKRNEGMKDIMCGSTLRTEDRDWQVVGEFKDEHRSAFRKAERNGFDALLAAAEAGMIDAIIAPHHDRLTRNPKDYDRLIEVCTHRGVTVHYYTGGALDFRTSQGGFMGTINTAIAQRESDMQRESDIRSERVKPQRAQRQTRQENRRRITTVRLQDHLSRPRRRVQASASYHWRAAGTG